MTDAQQNLVNLYGLTVKPSAAPGILVLSRLHHFRVARVHLDSPVDKWLIELKLRGLVPFGDVHTSAEDTFLNEFHRPDPYGDV